MRNKIDYGIDLGTTNSAIVRMEKGKPIITKSETLKDTTPSSVSINRKKNILVGDKALHAIKSEKTSALKNWKEDDVNSFLEFKRTIGTGQEYKSSNLGKSLTSEELSAEVLKKLKSYIIDENINTAVITVPAQFLNPQKDATMKAAQLAGFKQVELLQEPVAAATAFGLNSGKKDGYWIVFDFGGGTFDTALVKAEDGILSVKDTAGDNWLGGKNLDYAIVDEIIIPYLKENYAIDFVFNDKTKHQILRDAIKYFAEEAKNQLSFKDTYNILSNLGDLPFEDENGEEPEIDIDVTGEDMERVLSPIFQKAIDITKELLSQSNLKGSDIDALILVGGPTYSPVLRKMLREQITENVDTSIDPMTAVATGAALFASTISVSDEVREETRDKTRLQLEINYEATTVELKEMINIQILKDKTDGFIPEKVFVEVTRGQGDWSSGKKQISTKKKTLLDVILVEGANQFNVSTFDEHGNRTECQPDSFTMLQGIGGLDSITVLPYSIGIAKYFEAEGKNLFAKVKGLEKNQKLPATGTRNNLKTRITIRPGIAKDVIRIPIYQGEHNAEGTNPLLNNWVYDVTITGETIPKLLPEGSDVEITIKVDRSEKMKFSAFFPLIEHTEELEIDIKQLEPPKFEILEKEITQAQKTAKNVNDAQTLSKLEKLESELKNTGLTPDGRFQILTGLRKELLKLDKKEKQALWPETEKELKDTFFTLEDLIKEIKKNGDDEKLNVDKVDAHVEEFRKKIDLIIKDKNIKEAKALIQEMGQLDFNIRNIVTDNGMDVNYLRNIDNNFSTIKWKNKTRVDNPLELVPVKPERLCQ